MYCPIADVLKFRIQINPSYNEKNYFYYLVKKHIEDIINNK